MQSSVTLNEDSSVDSSLPQALSQNRSQKRRRTRSDDGHSPIDKSNKLRKVGAAISKKKKKQNKVLPSTIPRATRQPQPDNPPHNVGYVDQTFTPPIGDQLMPPPMMPPPRHHEIPTSHPSVEPNTAYLQKLFEDDQWQDAMERALGISPMIYVIPNAFNSYLNHSQRVAQPSWKSNAIERLLSDFDFIVSGQDMMGDPGLMTSTITNQ